MLFSMTRKTDKLVVVAGSGTLPFLVVNGAKSSGREVCVLGLRDYASSDLADLSDRFYWIPIARVGRWIRLARRFGAQELILAGAVRKSQAFSCWRIWRYLPDWRTLRIWYRRARSDRRDLALLSALADELEEAGLTVVNSVNYCNEALVEVGVLTKRSPSPQIVSDIDFAWPIARKIAEMDVGQSLAVREKDIIAVEAIEGTDAMIERAGQLVKNNWTLIKVAQPHQDMRFDVPTVGPETIKKLHEHHACALVVQAGKTIMLEKETTIQLADRYGIVIIGKE